MMFARELMKSGCQCYFIAPKLGADYLISSGIDPDKILYMPSRSKDTIDLNYAEFKNYINRVKPEIIVIADWYHFKADGTSNNCSYSLYWFSDKIPVITFDHLGFAPHGKKLEPDRFDISNLTVDISVLDFYKVPDRFSNIIRPCPHHHNREKQVGNIFYWGINSKNIDNEVSSKKDTCRRYQCNDAKIIFQSVGLWQDRTINKALKKAGINFEYYSDIFVPTMMEYLSSLNKEILYILVLGNEKKERIINNGNVTVVLIPPLGHHKFMNYLKNSDLFITDNLMSSNLGKAVFNEIPSLTIRNEVYINRQNELIRSYPITEENKKRILSLRKKGLLFPYLVFPLGLYEIGEMYEHNDFSSCFETAEMFDHTGCTKKLEQLLFDDEFISIQKNNQQKYIYQNTQLMSSYEIMESCI